MAEPSSISARAGTPRPTDPLPLAENVVGACASRLWRAVRDQTLAMAPEAITPEVKAAIAGKTLYDLPPEQQKALREEVIAVLEMAVAGLAGVPVGRFPDVQAWLAQERGRGGREAA
jgi:hypothetical protein